MLKLREIYSKAIFTWHALNTLRKRDAIAATTITIAKSASHSYAIEAPSSEEQDLEVYRKNGNAF